MSISTIAAARINRANAYWLAADERGRVELSVREEVKEAMAAMKGGDAQKIWVPDYRRTGGQVRETTSTLASVVQETMEAGNCAEQLLAVLRDSECPLVQQLREAMTTYWAGHVASDIADDRTGDL